MRIERKSMDQEEHFNNLINAVMRHENDPGIIYCHSRDDCE